MDLALLHLLRLRIRGSFRDRLTKLTSRHGLLYALVAVLLPCVLWGSGLFSPTTSAEALQGIAIRSEAWMVLALVITTLCGPAIHSHNAFKLSPAENSFLRTGPFSTQSLLLYKVSSCLCGAALSAFLLALVSALFDYRLPLAVFFGALLTLVFLELSRVCLASGFRLLVSSVGFRLSIFAAITLSGALLTLVWIHCVQQGLAPVENGSPTTVVSLLETEWIEVLLLPFSSLIRTTLAENLFPDLSLWGMLGLTVNLSLLLIVLRIDALGGSILCGGGQEQTTRRLTNSPGRSAPSIALLHRIPETYRDVVSICWLKTVVAFRGASTRLLLMGLVAIAAGPVMVHGLSSCSPLMRLGIVVTLAVFLLPRTLPFDFRDHSSRLQWIKRLPMKPLSVVAGHLAFPVLFTCLLEWVFLFSMMGTGDPDLFHWLLWVVPFVLPFNILLYAVENMLFLLAPFRVSPAERVDIEFFGRTLMDVAVKMVLLSASTIIAAMTAGYLGRQLGGGASLTGILMWLSMMFMAVGAVHVLVICFRYSEPASAR